MVNIQIERSCHHDSKNRWNSKFCIGRDGSKVSFDVGSFNYDEDLFSENFCLRMKSDSVEELTGLIESSLCNYSKRN